MIIIVADWKDIKIDGISSFKMLAAEFDVGEQSLTPYSKFKVKVYEKQDGTFIGYTNLMVKDEEGCPFPGVGFGITIEDALENTVRYFLVELKKKDNITENDFEVADPFDF